MSCVGVLASSSCAYMRLKAHQWRSIWVAVVDVAPVVAAACGCACATGCCCGRRLRATWRPLFWRRTPACRCGCDLQQKCRYHLHVQHEADALTQHPSEIHGEDCTNVQVRDPVAADGTAALRQRMLQAQVLGQADLAVQVESQCGQKSKLGKLLEIV